jgi:hypothetical protein
MLAATCAAAALSEVVYYVAANAYVAALGDAHLRGRQIAIGQALAAAAGVVAPLAAAWGLVTLGPRWTFASAALVQAASVVPLLSLPNITVAKSAPGAWRAARLSALLIVADGWFDAAFLYLWPVWLFLAFRQSWLAYGGAMALAGQAGAIFGLFAGRRVDMGHGRRATAIGYGAAALAVGLRAASLGLPWLAGFANALGGVVMPLMVPPLAAATHNLAQASPCPMRVKMATEGGWDVGCVAACLVAAALAQRGAPAWLGVLLAWPGLAVGAALLWRYYGVTAFKSPRTRP